MKVAFVTDSGTGKSVEEWKQKGIFSLPLQIEVGHNSYEEHENIQIPDVVSYLHQQKLLKTSLPKLGKIEDLFEFLKEQGYDAVFAVPICQGLSSTLQTMEMAAKTVDIKFYGIDCYSTAVVQDYMITKAKELYESGEKIETIIEKMKKIAHSCDTILLCDDLQHMKRGGRLTPMAAALGGLLKIKPILHVNEETNGRVDVLDKVRTMKKAQSYVIDRLIQRGVNASYTVVIAHVDAYEAACEFKKKVEEEIAGVQIQIIDLISTVSVHTGLGCLAIQAFDKRC